MAFGGFGWPLVKAGTFKVIDTTTSTVVCQDSQTFAYNQTGGNCPALGFSGFVNYQTGDYQVNSTFRAGQCAAISHRGRTSSRRRPSSTTFNRLQGIDLFGDGTCQSGYVASQFCKSPGGVNGHIFRSRPRVMMFKKRLRLMPAMSTGALAIRR